MECKVDGIATMDGTVAFVRGDTEYMFVRSDDGRLASVRITKPLLNPENAYAVFKRDERGGTAGVECRMDEGEFEGVIEEFKQLESMLAFSVEIRRLDWQCPTVSLVPETPEESKRVEIWDIQREFVSAAKPQFASASELRSIVMSLPISEALTVLQSFWREARNEVEARRYIPAFMNFFYVLEALYANGESKVLRKFEESDELRKLVEAFLKTPTATEPPHRDNLLEMLKSRQQTNDVRGLLKLLVATRGELHHYARTKHRQYGTPFRNREYHTIALLAMFLASCSILQEMRKLKAEARATSKAPSTGAS